jgi:TorA maturation chaperone TorD
MLNLDIEEAVDLARGQLYCFLASAFSDPRGGHFDLALEQKRQTVALAATDLLRSEALGTVELAAGEHSPAELDLRPVVAELQANRQQLAEQYQRVFGLLVGKTAPLNETEYCASTDSFYRAQELADIAGFYRAFGLERDRRRRERHDHLSIELEFMARLIGKEMFAERSTEKALKEKAAFCREAQEKFFEAHPGWWTPAFADLMRRAAPPGLYTALADALAAFIASERAFFGLAPPRPLAELQPNQETDVEADCCWSCPVAENQQRRTNA